jgi:hypothetical protein
MHGNVHLYYRLLISPTRLQINDFLLRVLVVKLKLLSHDLGDETGTDGAATLAEGEARTGLEGDVVDELTDQLDVVSGHDELLVRVLGALGEVEGDSHVGGADEELGAVVGHEGGKTATLLLGEDLWGEFKVLRGLFDGVEGNVTKWSTTLSDS